MTHSDWVMYCRKGESQMEFRRNRALVVGHVGFDYFITEDDLTFNEKIDFETKEDFENYINDNNLKPFLGGTAGNVCAVMREIGSLEVDRFSCGDAEGLLKYNKLSPDFQHGINKHIMCSDPYLTVPICLIFSKNEKQTVYIYDRTLDCYNHIQEFNIHEWGSDRQYELIHVTTLPPNAALKLFKECKEKTPESVLSFCPGQNLSLYHPPVLFEILSLVDILFVNDNEMRMLSEMVVNFGDAFRGFPDMIIHTRGGDPTLISTKEKDYCIPTVKPDRIVDTTGAGDAYAAAFLSEYMVSKDVVESAQFAATVASFIVEEVGCQTNIPNWNQRCERMKVWEKSYFPEGK